MKRLLGIAITQELLHALVAAGPNMPFMTPEYQIRILKRFCRIADLYEQVKFGPRDLYERAKYQLILDWLTPYKPLRILNAGFGSGVLSFLLAAEGHTVTGIDISEECHREVMKRVEELHGRGASQWLSRCSFHVSPIESFVADSPYDCVVATDVLEHVEDDTTLVEKICSFVAPGGIVVVTVPAGPWLFGHHDRLIGHYRRYTRKQLREKLRGLVAIRMLRYFGFSTIPACLIYSHVLRKKYPLAATGGDQRSRPFLSTIVSFILEIDRRMRMPFGTCVLCLGQRL